ncbi:MAG: hypothetical protein KIT87_11900 [Anaerolineae bacterium]|nr:hypothetical protein [Anaerolineae bacterium]
MSVRTSSSPSRFPLLTLLNPGELTPVLVVALLLGILVGVLQMAWMGWPLWAASATALGVVLAPATLKWRADRRRYGVLVMVLSVLVAAQTFHGLEHLAQWIQYHILDWPGSRSSGLISAANAEWVHFVWNWSVVLVVIYLVRGGMRNGWAWLLLAWSVAHALEHTYMMVRYLQVNWELEKLGFQTVSAQGLPGIFGRDGWLARSALTQGVWYCQVPGLTTAPRLDIHFWWNVGETALLLIAAHTFLRGWFNRPAANS